MTKLLSAWLKDRRAAFARLCPPPDAEPAQTPLTRAGYTLLLAGFLLDTLEPVLSVAVAVALCAAPVWAQGTIFGQDQSMVPNAVRQVVIFAAGIAFLIGALMIIWGAFQYSRRQECMNCFVGGGLMMTIGGVIALVSYLSSGRAVSVDRTLN